MKFTAIMRGNPVEVVPGTAGRFESPTGWVRYHGEPTGVAISLGDDAAAAGDSISWSRVDQLTGHAIDGSVVPPEVWGEALRGACTAADFRFAEAPLENYAKREDSAPGYVD